MDEREMFEAAMVDLMKKKYPGPTSFDIWLAARRTIPDPANGAFVSRVDLDAIYAAMNHLGDILNEMDAVEAEDEAATEPGFIAIRRALGEKE